MMFFKNQVAIPNGTVILWSLAVEADFYAIYPLLFSFFLRKYSKKQFFIFLISICILILLWRCFLTYGGAQDSRMYYCTDTRIDAIIFGCILALSKFNPLLSEKYHKKEAKPDFILTCSLFIFSFGLLGFSLLYRDPFFRATFRYSLQSIALLPLFWMAIKYYNFSIFKLLNTTILKRIGQLSYFIYLVHFALISVLQSSLFISNRLSLFFISLITSTLLAYLVEQYIERPLGKLREKV
jgi:peptidoglycan/LPS O-acetylase OafA/YrhL